MIFTTRKHRWLIVIRRPSGNSNVYAATGLKLVGRKTLEMACKCVLDSAGGIRSDLVVTAVSYLGKMSDKAWEDS